VPPFRQAPPDPDKAAANGVAKYIPKRSEPDRSHVCKDCDLTARWAIVADGLEMYACDSHRQKYLFTAKVYREKNLR
jgi:hypothetical protein